MITTTSTPESDLARVAAAIEEGKPLGTEQVQLFGAIITFEVQALRDELKGKSTTPETEYPSNLTLENFARYPCLAHSRIRAGVPAVRDDKMGLCGREGGGDGGHPDGDDND